MEFIYTQSTEIEKQIKERVVHMKLLKIIEEALCENNPLTNYKRGEEFAENKTIISIAKI